MGPVFSASASERYLFAPIFLHNHSGQFALGWLLLNTEYRTAPHASARVTARVASKKTPIFPMGSRVHGYQTVCATPITIELRIFLANRRAALPLRCLSRFHRDWRTRSGEEAF